MRKSAFTTILLGGIVLFTGMATAAERHVPSGYATIQAAINACNSGDVVIVAPGTYTGNGNRDIDFLGKAITVTSVNPDDPCVVATTVIDCNGSAAEPHRGFYFHNAESPNSVLAGLTVSNGYATNGGGIYCTGASPLITNCIFTNGVATNWGGGIHCYQSSPIISDCTFTRNSADEGGAITTYLNCAPLIKNCRMLNNFGSLDGGAFDSDCLSTPVLSNCVITGNRSGSSGGGGIAIWESNPIIKNCIIAGNYTEGWGSGIHQGYSFSDGAKISNCVITENTGLDNGEYGILCGGGTKMVVTNSIIGGNIDTIPGDFLWTSCDETFAYCDALNSRGSGTNWHVALVKDGGGNIDVSPQFISPGHWDANGTPGVISDDFWVDGDYHLKSQAGRWDPNSKSWVKDANTSPCIDAGDPNSDWTKELWPHGKRINMGAYGGTPQASMSLSTVGNIANLNNDPCDIIDFNDLALFVGKWLYEEVLLPEDLDRNGTVNFVDYAIFAQQWLYTPAEPGIEYEISPCQMGLSATEQLDETRFTVTVEGRYIHFEDMMVANCCAKELWLEMTVEDNLITINENEWGGDCYCICDYPVTAILGPFGPGTYVLKVYNHGLVGSTTVVIE